jgi:hypothetical protein
LNNNLSLLNSGLDAALGANFVPQVPGQSGRFHCESAFRALQAVQGPGRQGSEQDSQCSTERQEELEQRSTLTHELEPAGLHAR